MPDRYAAWRGIGQVFLLNRLLVLCITCVCIFVLPALIPGYKSNISADASTYHLLPSPNLNLLLFSWLHWDAKAYLNISYLGYHHQPDVGFFPLWPLTQHIGGSLLGGSFPVSYYLAGLLLANLFFYFDLVLLYQLIAKGFGPAVARRLLFYFSFSPFALFFFRWLRRVALCSTDIDDVSLSPARPPTRLVAGRSLWAIGNAYAFCRPDAGHPFSGGVSLAFLVASPIWTARLAPHIKRGHTCHPDTRRTGHLYDLSPQCHRQCTSLYK